MGKVRQARRRVGMSQVELAKAAGVSPATIVEIERRHRRPYGRTLKKLASALDVTVVDLLEDEVEAETTPKSPARSELPAGSEAGRPSDEKPPPVVEHVGALVLEASSPPVTAKSKVVELLERVKRDELSVEDAAARLKLRDTKAS